MELGCTFLFSFPNSQESRAGSLFKHAVSAHWEPALLQQALGSKLHFPNLWGWDESCWACKQRAFLCAAPTSPPSGNAVPLFILGRLFSRQMGLCLSCTEPFLQNCYDAGEGRPLSWNRQSQRPCKSGAARGCWASRWNSLPENEVSREESRPKTLGRQGGDGEKDREGLRIVCARIQFCLKLWYRS